MQPASTSRFNVANLAADLPPARCHQYETKPARQRKKYDYTCDCGTNFKLGATRHRKIQQGLAKYYCKRCNTYLRQVI